VVQWGGSVSVSVPFSWQMTSSSWGLGCPQLFQFEADRQACVWSAGAEHYKSLQDIAYLNADGASPLSVCALMLVYPLTVALQRLVARVASKHLGIRAGNLAEFIAAILPLTIAFSAPHLVWTILVTLACAGAALFAHATDLVAWPRLLARVRATRAARRTSTAAHSACFMYIDPAGTRLRFVSEYRAVMMITTCIVILAVDFPSIFPRRHAKTDEYGYSLMDLGTGCIVCATAICSRAARGITAASGCKEQRPFAVLKRVLSLWPLLTLGFVRLAALKGMDYHVPTSEYGVHWNFFFTIAVIAVVTTATDFSPSASIVAGSAVLVLYQVFLSAFGGAEYILRAPRDNLFSANREGMFSCFGFLAVHWFSVGLGSLVASKTRLAQRTTWFLIVIAGLGFSATALFSTIGIIVSRRMCNVSYVTFIMGINALVLALLALVDLYWPFAERASMPSAYGGVQDSMLVVFLLANLLTGAVNVSAQPLLVPAWASLLIMICYSFTWSAAISIVHSRSVVLKFW